MSLETTESTSPSMQPLEVAHGRTASPDKDSQWESLRVKIRGCNGRPAIREVLGDSIKAGGIYRWGIAAALGAACPDEWQVLSRLACGIRLPKRYQQFDSQEAAERFLDSLSRTGSATESDGLRSAATVIWAAALPELTRHLSESRWWDLLGGLQQYRESVLQRGKQDDPAYLLVAAELGLTLAWKLADAPSCKRLSKSSLDAFASWCRHDEEAVNNAVAGGRDARLALASFIRCQSIIETTTRRKVKKAQRRTGTSLATWVAALTTIDGHSAFSDATRKDLVDDLPPRGLLAEAISFDRETLKPAIEAALGKSQSGGRLAWEVCLPEAYHHSEQSKLAVMFPDWDVRRGRIHLDYSGNENQIELFAGRTAVLRGACETQIEYDGVGRDPCGSWEMTCEYSDDDVHYVELEQAWTGDLRLQRQWMLIRDDRCVLFADGVVPSRNSSRLGEAPIRYDCRIPLAPSVSAEPEAETRDLFLSDGKARGLVMPLSAGEWRIGPTAATLNATEDGHLVISSRGTGRLYVPLWFDFQARRFKRKRTWRQLTVADQLRIVDASEATGFRVQVGSQQWMLYRSLDTSVCRSVLGKHLIADFFAARFDPSDGSFEELVTVDDEESDES